MKIDIKDADIQEMIESLVKSTIKDYDTISITKIGFGYLEDKRHQGSVKFFEGVVEKIIELILKKLDTERVNGKD